MQIYNWICTPISLNKDAMYNNTVQFVQLPPPPTKDTMMILSTLPVYYNITLSSDGKRFHTISVEIKQSAPM